MNEQMAQMILQAAINENRAAELLECLFNGGSCTIGPDQQLTLISSEMLAMFTKD